jgi:hypothetical protein
MGIEKEILDIALLSNRGEKGWKWDNDGGDIKKSL